MITKLRKFPWFPGYKVEVKYKLFSLKKFVLSFFMITIYVYMYIQVTIHVQNFDEIKF